MWSRDHMISDTRDHVISDTWSRDLGHIDRRRHFPERGFLWYNTRVGCKVRMEWDRGTIPSRFVLETLVVYQRNSFRTQSAGNYLDDEHDSLARSLPLSLALSLSDTHTTVSHNNHTACLSMCVNIYIFKIHTLCVNKHTHVHPFTYVYIYMGWGGGERGEGGGWGGEPELQIMLEIV